MRLKSRNHQKAQQQLILNLHTKFQLRTSTYKRVFYRPVKRYNEVDQSKPSKDPYEVSHAEFQRPSSICRKDRRGVALSQAQNGGETILESPRLLPSNEPRRLILGFAIQLWIIHQSSKKRKIFPSLKFEPN